MARLLGVFAAVHAIDAGAQAPRDIPACLDALTGTWVGRGRVAGRDVAMRQEWSRAVGSAFSELRMTHRLPADTGQPVFEGRGFYRTAGAADSITGTWLDARGFIMSLAGRCDGASARMRWQGTTESGATTYTLTAGGRLEVVDEVAVGGSLREFGRTLLDREGPMPELLGSGSLSTEAPEFATTVTPDGREWYFNRTSADRSQLTIMVSAFDGRGWGAARTVEFSGTFRDIDPHVSPDGRRLYFSSDRPRPGTRLRSFSTWYVERRADGSWSAPIDPGVPVNSDSSDVFVSSTHDGDVVFSSTRHGPRDVFITRETAGRWSAPVALGVAGAPGNPAVSPSGRWLVFTRDVPGRGADLFVSCRTMTGFGPAVAMPTPINGAYADFAPAFDATERWLFFTSERPGMVGPQPDGVRPPGDLYRVRWEEVAPRC